MGSTHEGFATARRPKDLAQSGQMLKLTKSKRTQTRAHRRDVV
jgi:hypothetical protein